MTTMTVLAPPFFDADGLCGKCALGDGETPSIPCRCANSCLSAPIDVARLGFVWCWQWQYYKVTASTEFLVRGKCRACKDGVATRDFL